MNQAERLALLTEEFKKESEGYSGLITPEDRVGKRALLRSLMNVRLPGKMLPKGVLDIQDDYLKERAKEKGIVTLRDIPITKGVLSIWQGDITRLKVDAIINAANNEMLGCFIPMHNCIDNAIHTFAGVELREECYRKMSSLRAKYGRDYVQPVSIPMLTGAYNLPAKKVIHIVGPIVQGRLREKDREALTLCYKNILDLCAENELKSVAFCSISTGVFHFPKHEAALIATRTVGEYIDAHPGLFERVIFDVFTDEDKGYYEELLA